MTKRVDDITEVNPLDAETEDTSVARDMVDAYGGKVKQAVGDRARSTVKRFLWSIPLAFTLTSEYDKDRILDKLERGQKVHPYEFFFGEKFNLFNVLRLVLFIVLIGAVIFLLWQNGFFEMLREQQALIDSIQTPTAP